MFHFDMHELVHYIEESIVDNADGDILIDKHIWTLLAQYNLTNDLREFARKHQVTLVTGSIET